MRGWLFVTAAVVELITTAFATAGQADTTLPTAIVELTINTEGRVCECRIVTSSGASQRDEQTCMIAMRRFRFQPQIVDGQSVPFKKTMPVRWDTDASGVK